MKRSITQLSEELLPLLLELTDMCMADINQKRASGIPKTRKDEIVEFTWHEWGTGRYLLTAEHMDYDDGVTCLELKSGTAFIFGQNGEYWYSDIAHLRLRAKTDIFY